MSRTLDALETALHGTPSGYLAGCRSKGGCPNHADREQLTCARAYRAWCHYFQLHAAARDQPITRTMLRAAKRRSEMAPAPRHDNTITRTR